MVETAFMLLGAMGTSPPAFYNRAVLCLSLPSEVGRDSRNSPSPRLLYLPPVPA